MAFSKHSVGLGIGVSGAAFWQPVMGLPALTFLRAANLCTHSLQQLRVSSLSLIFAARLFFLFGCEAPVFNTLCACAEATVAADCILVRPELPHAACYAQGSPVCAKTALLTLTLNTQEDGSMFCSYSRSATAAEEQPASGKRGEQPKRWLTCVSAPP